MESLLAMKERAAQALANFLKLESAGGLLLVAAAALGLAAANSPWSGWYLWLQDLPLTVKLGSLGVDKPLLLWINDGLMAVFFLLVALELKREVLQGVFTDRRLVALPAACALGGMLVPMGVYAWLNRGPGGAMAGVAIPAATDIAFALGVLSLLGSRVPVALKVLLTAIAVLDDLGAIVIIAVYYTDEMSALSLGVAGAALAGLVIANRAGVTRWSVYILLGLVMWVAVLKSGVHATLAGVALGLTIPLADPRQPDRAPLAEMEHALHPWVAYAILPVFAFANAGVSLSGASVATLAAPVPMGIALGLFLGKPVGVFGAAAVMIGSGLARRPNGVSWAALLGMSILCGIGFTMSLFIGSLAFGESGDAIQLGKQVGIFAGSLGSALVGYALLRRVLRDPPG